MRKLCTPLRLSKGMMTHQRGTEVSSRCSPMPRQRSDGLHLIQIRCNIREPFLPFAPKQGRRYTARIGVKTWQLSHFATPTRREPAEVGTNDFRWFLCTNVSLAHLHKRVLAIPHRTPSRHIRSNVPRRNNVPPISSTLTRPAASDHGAGVALLHPVALPSAEIAALDCF